MDSKVLVGPGETLTEAQVRARFVEQFGDNGEAIHCFFAPGRVNIIGEHQDYNGGHVFPAALTLGTWGAIRLNKGQTIRFHSANMAAKTGDEAAEGTKEIPYTTRTRFTYTKEHNWINYPLGVIDYFIGEGYEVPAFDLYFEGNLPEGAGLSSSACILDLTVYMLMHMLDIPIDRTRVAEIAKDVEYDFIGVKVGIMDQFAISHGKEGHGVFLDCTKMEFEHVPVDFGDYRLVIMNTNHQRSLVDSVFNVRKAECDAALEDIRKHHPLEALCLGSVDDLDFVEDEVNRRRAKHAITENLRVLAFMDALRTHDMESIKDIITASHESLRYDYEVSGRELDTIVAIARKQPGCLASRMTGAGFGGCAIAIVDKAQLEDFMAGVIKEYESEIGVTPDLYIADLGDGVHHM